MKRRPPRSTRTDTLFPCTALFRDGEVSIGVTYMTGALVKLGQRLAAALVGGPRWQWAPYLALWGGLIAGAAAGAPASPRAGMASLWIAVAARSEERTGGKEGGSTG